MQWETESLEVLHNSCSSEREQLAEDIQTESRIENRVGSLVGLLELKSREEFIRTCALPSPSQRDGPLLCYRFEAVQGEARHAYSQALRDRDQPWKLARCSSARPSLQATPPESTTKQGTLE